MVVNSLNHKLFIILFCLIIFLVSFKREFHPFVIVPLLFIPKNNKDIIAINNIFILFFSYLLIIFILQFFYITDLQINFAIRNIYYILIFFLGLRFFLGWNKLISNKKILLFVLVYSFILYFFLNLFGIEYRFDFFRKFFGNFHIINIIFLIFIFILVNEKIRNTGFFFLFIFILLSLQGYLTNSQQSLVLGLFSFFSLLIPEKLKHIYAKFLYMFLIFFPILIISLVTFIEGFSDFDANILFRSEAYQFHIENFFNSFYLFNRLDLIIHPFFINEFEILTQNISTHNFFIDSIAKYSLLGGLLSLLIIKKFIPNINEMNNNKIMIFIWTAAIVHLSINQIYTFKDIILLSFLLSFMNIKYEKKQ